RLAEESGRHADLVLILAFTGIRWGEAIALTVADVEFLKRRISVVQEITPHDLRHTCASLAVSSGANVLAVSRMFGHKDPSVTLRIYADLFDSDLDAVAVNLDAKIASSVQSVSKAPADRRRERRKTAV